MNVALASTRIRIGMRDAIKAGHALALQVQMAERPECLEIQLQNTTPEYSDPLRCSQGACHAFHVIFCIRAGRMGSVVEFSGESAAQEHNHPGGGDKQRKAEKKRRTWVLRNGGFQLGHTERGENRRGGREMQAEAATAMRKRKKRDAERIK